MFDLTAGNASRSIENHHIPKATHTAHWKGSQQKNNKKDASIILYKRDSIKKGDCLIDWLLKEKCRDSKRNSVHYDS